MAENESFFRKVVRFVANPATDWHELNSRQDEGRELDAEKTELKAMIERKRRNDFVRKREFDMLRRVRREGLSPEQLAALGGSSRLDDSEARLPDQPARGDAGVKAKIDEIEQQMVGDGFSVHGRSAPASVSGPPSRPPAPPRPAPPVHAPASGVDPDLLPALPPLRDGVDAPDIALPPAAAQAPMQMTGRLPPLAAPTTPASFDLPPLAPAPARAAPEPRPVAPAPAGVPAEATMASGGGWSGPPGTGVMPPPAAKPPTQGAAGQAEFGLEVSEAVHDPELDEAVISFANADFNQSEELLRMLTAAGGARADHAETWLVLFDLYRATGQQPPFESLAIEYAQQFGWSAPQWYSLPRLVADAAAEEPLARTAAPTRGGDDIGWVCPDHLDLDAVIRLRSQTLQLPLPWVFEWGGLRSIDTEAAMQLSTLFRLWAGQGLEMRWVGGDQLFIVLQEAAPTGVRDADPAFWLTRLDGLRLTNRADQFDEAAIDYCVTYEVSPPSWEPARCKVQITSSNRSTRAAAMSVISEVSTSFQESGLGDDAGGVAVAHVELSGQLVGDIGATLQRLSSQLGSAPLVQVSCARLIRVDFIAAGDLLNWVLARRNENRSVTFYDTHRLVALFFGAMGINEHARVQVRKV
jgi:hypothetical protein